MTWFPSGLHYSVFHSVSLPIQRSQRSMNDKVMRSFLIRGFAARTVTSHWARKGRAAHPLFTLSTGCQVQRWGPSVPAVHVGLRSKEVAPRPGRPCLLWPRRLRGHVISDSLTLTAAGRWHRQYVDLTRSLSGVQLSEFTVQQITMATWGFILGCNSVPGVDLTMCSSEAPLVRFFSFWFLLISF